MVPKIKWYKVKHVTLSAELLITTLEITLEIRNKRCKSTFTGRFGNTAKDASMNVTLELERGLVSTPLN